MFHTYRGTGSATQLIPRILSKVNSLDHFIRSPQHYVRRVNPTISGAWRYTLEHVPLLFNLIRCLLFHMLDYAFVSYRTDLRQGGRARARSSAASERYVRSTAPAIYWSYLRPAYPFGCKRTILDSQYLAALHEEKMQLISDPIGRIETNAIVTKAEVRHHADVVVSTPEPVSLRKPSSAWLDRFWQLASRPHAPVSLFQGRMASLWTSIGRVLEAELHINQFRSPGSPICFYSTAQIPLLPTLQPWRRLRILLT